MEDAPYNSLKENVYKKKNNFTRMAKKILMFDQKHNKIKLLGLWKDFGEEKALSYIISGDIN